MSLDYANTGGPSCCGTAARWIDNGPRLQYWLCDECKKEVTEPESAQLEQMAQISDDDFDKLYGSNLIINTPSGVTVIGPANPIKPVWLDGIVGELNKQIDADINKIFAIRSEELGCLPSGKQYVYESTKIPFRVRTGSELKAKIKRWYPGSKVKLVSAAVNPETGLLQQCRYDFSCDEITFDLE